MQYEIVSFFIFMLFSVCTDLWSGCCETDRRKADRVDLDDQKSEWEMKTITSAIKNYFRYAFHPSQYTGR